MEKLIVYIDSPSSKIQIKEALKIFRGVTGVSDKLSKTDLEDLADDALIKEMKKADKMTMLSYDDGKKEFEKLKKRLTK